MISVNKNLGNSKKTKINKTDKCNKNMLIKCKHKINLILCLIKNKKINLTDWKEMIMKFGRALMKSILKKYINICFHLFPLHNHRPCLSLMNKFAKIC